MPKEKKFSKPKELEVGADPSEYIEGFLAKQDAAAAYREIPEGKAAQKAADEALYDQLLANERKRWKEAEEREKNRNQCSAEDLMAAESVFRTERTDTNLPKSGRQRVRSPHPETL